MNARRMMLDNGRTLIVFSERGPGSHTDECAGEHDPISGACISPDEDERIERTPEDIARFHADMARIERGRRSAKAPVLQVVK